MRHYYALSDSFTGPNPAEPSSGFANRGEVIAFSSLGARTAWLAATNLLEACAITRPEAIKLTPALKAPSYLKGLKVLIARALRSFVAASQAVRLLTELKAMASQLLAKPLAGSFGLGLVELSDKA